MLPTGQPHSQLSLFFPFPEEASLASYFVPNFERVPVGEITLFPFSLLRWDHDFISRNAVSSFGGDSGLLFSFFSFLHFEDASFKVSSPLANGQGAPGMMPNSLQGGN